MDFATGRWYWLSMLSNSRPNSCVRVRSPNVPSLLCYLLPDLRFLAKLNHYCFTKPYPGDRGALIATDKLKLFCTNCSEKCSWFAQLVYSQDTERLCRCTITPACSLWSAFCISGIYILVCSSTNHRNRALWWDLFQFSPSNSYLAFPVKRLRCLRLWTWGPSHIWTISRRFGLRRLR